MRTRHRYTRSMDVDVSFAKAGRCFDVAQHLNHPAVVRAFLWNAVATGDAGIIRRAEASIARAAERRGAGRTASFRTITGPAAPDASGALVGEAEDLASPKAALRQAFDRLGRGTVS